MTKDLEDWIKEVKILSSLSDVIEKIKEYKRLREYLIYYPLNYKQRAYCRNLLENSIIKK